MNEFLDNFFNELKNEEINEELINSFKELVDSDEFSKENLIDLIDGVFDE